MQKRNTVRLGMFAALMTAAASDTAKGNNRHTREPGAKYSAEAQRIKQEKAELKRQKHKARNIVQWHKQALGVIK